MNSPGNGTERKGHTIAYTTYRVPSQGSQYQGSGYPVDYQTFRNLKGSVSGRLIDVSLPGGAYWSYAQLFVTLLDSAGNQYGSHYLDKAWSVMPGFQNIGFVAGGKLIRLRTYGNFVAPSYWVMELRCDNSNAV